MTLRVGDLVPDLTVYLLGATGVSPVLDSQHGRDARGTPLTDVAPGPAVLVFLRHLY